MTIVSNLNNLVTPGVYTLEQSPNPSVVAAGQGRVALVGTSTYGPTGQSVQITSPAEFIDAFGAYSSSYGDGLINVYHILNQGAPAVKFVRVIGTGAVKASFVITGAVTGNSLTLTALHYGTDGNRISGSLETVTGTTDTQMLTILFGAKKKVYTFTSGEAISGLAAKINKDPDRMVDAASAGSGTLLTGTSLTAFSGGTNGAAVAATDRIGSETSTGPTGHRVIDADDEVDIVTSALNDSTTNGDIVNMCLPTPNIKPRVGRISVGTSVATAVSAMSGYNTDAVSVYYGDVFAYNPWSQLYEQVPVQLLAAGTTASVPVQRSNLNLQVRGNIISGVNVPSASQVATLISNRINPLTLIVGRGWTWRSDRTASANDQLRQSTRRRSVNFLSRSLDESLFFLVGRNHIPQLRQDALTAVDTFLAQQSTTTDPNFGPVLGTSDGRTPYKVICDSTNNPPDVVRQNRLVMQVIVSLPAVVEYVVLYLDAAQENINIVES